MTEELLARIEEMLSLIKPGGALEAILPGYCFRNQQEELVRSIATALACDEYLLAEAGTGVGKSLSYLIPAAYYAHLTGEKVVVATRTKALQDQLLEHDLPLVARLLPFPIRYAEARGRENYLCPARLQKIIHGRTELTSEEAAFVESIVSWAAHTGTGDRKELDLDSRSLRNWQLVASDRFHCQNGNCGYEESCFRLRARRTWEKADILVTNHALLLTDAQMGNSLLPEYHSLILDEAHQIPRQAQELFSTRFSLAAIRDLTGRFTLRTGPIERGVLPALQARYPHLGSLVDTARHWRYQVEESALRVFSSLEQLLDRQADNYRIRLTPSQREKFFARGQNEWEGFLVAVTELQAAIKALAEEISDEDRNEMLGSLLVQMDELINSTGVLEFDWGSRERVVWMEPEQGTRFTCVVSAPLWAGEELHHHLYSRLGRLVMTSATLSVEEDFTYFIQHCGLKEYQEQELVQSISLLSPFDYNKNCRVFIPEDIDLPRGRNFERQVARAITDVALASRRRCLVLFTSHQQLKSVAAAIRPSLESQGIPLLVQNEDGQFSTLIARMQTTPSAVLMGTETFWEGVDLPGELLSLLIVVKLPFRSPADPFYQAWTEAAQDHPMSVFSQLMLPEAVLKLKQGMGRLIRSEGDRGVIVVLDRRLLPPPQGRPYWRSFIHSLPMRRIEKTTLQQLADEIRDWV